MAKKKFIGPLTQKQAEKEAARRANRATRKTMVVRAQLPNPLSDPRVAAWDLLLRDPCSAPLAHPCYQGGDAGYLIRTTDYITLSSGSETGLTATAIYPLDGYVQICPFNISSSTGQVGAVRLTSVGTAGQTSSTSGYGSNFIASASVKRYRPVACCLKWIPTGPYTSRQGLVSMATLTGQEVDGGTAYDTNGVARAMQHYASNGAEPHEVRWIPTAVDENFTTASAVNNTGAACVLIALQGVDGTASNATTVVANGRFEFTCVWEWQPSVGMGVAASVQPPLPYTTQQVLATIGDFGKYVFQGVRASRAGQQAFRAGVETGLAYLTSGVRTRGTRGGSMPMVQR